MLALCSCSQRGMPVKGDPISVDCKMKQNLYIVALPKLKLITIMV